MKKHLYLQNRLIQSRFKINENNTNLKLIEENLLKLVNQYNESKNINLIISYYKDKNLGRSAEIDLCLKLNCKNKLFNKIIIINETMEDINFIEKSDNLIILNNSNRLKFKDMFEISNRYTFDDTINILINSDIVIGENFDKINLKSNDFFTLTRYNILEDGTNKFQDDSGSQDTWIWRGLLNHNIGNFRMGIPCCDPVIAKELSNFYKLQNPSLDLKTYHVHTTGIRNYNLFNKINGDCLKVEICKLNC